MAVVLKVECEGQLHRILLPSDVDYETIRQCIRELSASEDTVAKYVDEENDLCTLCQSSFLDFVSLASLNNGKKILKLFVTVGTPCSPAADAATVTKVVVEETDHSASVAEEAVATEVTEQAVVTEHVASTVDTEVQSLIEAVASTEEVAEAVATPDEEVAEAVATPDEEVVEAVATPDEEVAEAVATPDEETPAAAPDEESSIVADEHAPDTEHTASADGMDLLTSMGFSRLQASQALEVARGNVELAVEYLLKGDHRDGPNLGALPRNVMEQLRKLQVQLRDMVVKIQQHSRTHAFSIAHTFQGNDSEHLQSLQAGLEEMKARLLEFRKLAEAALKKASDAMPDADARNEQLWKVEAQIADAQQFLAETIGNLRASGSEVLKGAMAKCAVAEAAEGSATVASETMDAAATAAADAAEVAMATVDDFFFDETSAAAGTGPSGLSQDDSASGPCRQQGIAGATPLDHAQVLVSKSLSAIRAKTSGLLKATRKDNWVTIPTSSSASASGGAAAGSSGVTLDGRPNGDEHEGAESVRAASPEDADDTFLLVNEATKEADSEETQ